MNLLILGGTRFLGRSIAERAVALGHDVTLFHRGTTTLRTRPYASSARSISIARSSTRFTGRLARASRRFPS